MNGIPLIDSDIVAFRCAAACKDDEPVEFALHSCKIHMDSFVELFDRGLEQRGFLTGPGNYRYDLATIQPYKGNRKDIERPKYLQQCRDYLVYTWGAVVVEGKEADDALATLQYASKDKSTCICTIDKDILYGVPGWKYNFVKKEYFYTTLDEADHYFYRQVLTGDRSDNIRGVDGIGPAKADKILDGATTNRERYRRCKETFTQKYGKDGTRQLHETANLVWIQRKEGEMWQCPVS